MCVLVQNSAVTLRAADCHRLDARHETPDNKRMQQSIPWARKLASGLATDPRPVGNRGKKMKFTNWTEAEIKRWLWLRAVEWAAFPAYVSQPLVPIMFIFFPWYWVIATVVTIGIIWSLIRYSYVNVTIATVACLVVVWAKWPSAIGSSIYLFLHHQPVPAIIALAWPLLGGFVGVPGKIGVIELAFAKRIGFVPQDTEL
jgi:hypothetical protein